MRGNINALFLQRLTLKQSLQSFNSSLKAKQMQNEMQSQLFVYHFTRCKLFGVYILIFEL